MAEQDLVNNELRQILDEFTRFRDAYLALQTYSELQEERISAEKERSTKMEEAIEKLSQTYLLLERRHKLTTEKLQAENGDLRKTVEELKEQCDHLRLISTDHNRNDDEICRLQDQIEVLTAQLLMQEEKYGEDVKVLKQQHSDELQRYKMLLQNAKQASTTGEPKKRGRAKTLEKNGVQCFRWPKLDIQRADDDSQANDEAIGNACPTRIKKRKLFYEDRETMVDIV
ncbi:unnamed protein product [Xylocopa violacea]|uniref:Uncharacterized protein n=1 Tax=Xylocopa violacea TaxID=135666 RepID=A0ABP1NLZ8_XYLVO